MASMDKWTESKKGLHEYLGNKCVQVDDEMWDYALGVVPPIFQERTAHAATNVDFLTDIYKLRITSFMQIGEPFDHNDDGYPRYQTFVMTENGEKYSIGNWPNLNKH